MSLRQLLNPAPPPPKTAPTYRDSALASVASSGSLEVTVPAGAQPGDLALFFLSTHVDATVTPPAGVTLVDKGVGDSAQVPTLWLFTRTIEAGDASSVITFTSDITNKSWLCATGVYADVGGYSVAPEFYICHTTETLNNRDPRVPSIAAGPDDIIVGATATGCTALSPTGGDLTVAPPGTTIRQTGSEQVNGLILPYGVGLFDGPHHDLQLEAVDFDQNCYWVGAILALSPVAPRWADMERVPSTQAEKRVYAYTNSSDAFVKKQEINSGYNTRTPWGDRIATALGDFAGSNNMALFGARSADICTFAYGTASRATRSASGEVMSVAQAGTQIALPDRSTSLYVTDLVGNDALALGTGPKALSGARHATRSVFRLIRAAGVFAHTSPTVTKTGTWSTSFGDGFLGGSASVSTTPGDTITLGFSNTPAIDVVLVGFDNANLGGTGATYSIKVDDVEVATGTTHEQMAQTTWGSGTNYRFVQQTIPVTGIGAGAHTVTITHTGTSGASLMFNCWLVPGVNPPWITSNCLGELAAATYTTLGVPKADIDLYKELLRTVTEEFDDGRVIFYDPSASGRWDPLTMIATDGVHQNELGHAHYAHELLRMLTERVA